MATVPTKRERPSSNKKNRGKYFSKNLGSHQKRLFILIMITFMSGHTFGKLQFPVGPNHKQ
jgi:hypothetical protein